MVPSVEKGLSQEVSSGRSRYQALDIKGPNGCIVRITMRNVRVVRK